MLSLEHENIGHGFIYAWYQQMPSADIFHAHSKRTYPIKNKFPKFELEIRLSHKS